MGDLLETLRQNSGCNYISDLHISCFAPEVKKGVFSLSDSAFSAEEWNRAASYISGTSRYFDSVPEIKSFLSNFLEMADS